VKPHNPMPKSIVFNLNPGSFSGPTGTLSNAIYVSMTNNPLTASLLSGASFNDVRQGSGGSVSQVAWVDCKDTNRYMFLFTQLAAATASTVSFGATAILGRADKVPTIDNTRKIFDL